jgi:CarD family transcriptional regulator
MFKVGDKVVYPHHGAATVKKKEKRVNPAGDKVEYLVLEVAYSDLVLFVPEGKVEQIGVRNVINDKEVLEVVAVLEKTETRTPSNWSRRFKNHQEKLKSGDIYQVAEVVRNLTILDNEKGLSAGEKRMLSTSRNILTSEMSFAIGIEREEVEDLLAKILLKEPYKLPKLKAKNASGKKPGEKAEPKEAAVKKPAAKKAPAKKAEPKKAAVKKPAAKKAPAAKKSAVKKSPAKKK